MYAFLKSQVTSLVATAVDFATTICLVELVHIWYGAATPVGNLTGAITSFILNRQWTFHADEQKVGPQMLKYLAVWLGYMALNTMIVILLQQRLETGYIAGKLIGSVLLSITYNYTLYKKFVFRQQ